MISELTDKLNKYYPNITTNVYPIRNDFFGERITVTGLLTGRDILEQLKGREHGDRLYLPENLLRYGTEVLLDDMTVSSLSDALQVSIGIVKSDGAAFIEMYEEC